MNKPKFWALILLMIFILISCSSRTMSYFFDGVSQEDSLQGIPSDSVTSDTSALSTTEETVMIEAATTYHPDYRQKKCEKCHQLEHGNRLKHRQPEICYQCHKNINEKYEQIHGPVAAGFCSTCHEPHKSRYPALLKMAVHDICQHCHEPGDVARNEAHLKTSNIECLECHNPHGGKTVNLLRENKNN